MKKNKSKRFANVCLAVMAVITLLFVVANFITFYLFQVEQTALISAYFGCVGVELVALISKRISDNKYKHDDNSSEAEDFSGKDFDDEN